MQQRGIQHPVTRELFHGTSGDVCARIYKDGFDRSYCGKHGEALFFAFFYRKKKATYAVLYTFQARYNVLPAHTFWLHQAIQLLKVV